MKIDLYTKLVLTVIAIGIAMLVFEQKPMKEAQAGIMGGGEMIATPSRHAIVFHLKDGKVRFCEMDKRLQCTGYQ
jgi:hypothetical protein